VARAGWMYLAWWVSEGRGLLSKFQIMSRVIFVFNQFIKVFNFTRFLQYYLHTFGSGDKLIKNNYNKSWRIAGIA